MEAIPCSPHQSIAETVSLLRVRAAEKGISLSYRWEGAIPESIHTDPYRLKQVLMNLVGNAIKFTEQGSVLIVGRLDQRGEAPILEIEVRDTGVGIPEEKMDEIFKPFVQADNSVTRRYGGTGLGLTICRNIAAALDGELTAASMVGLGSTFTLRVAAGELNGVRLFEQPPQTAGADIIESGSGQCDLEGRRILVVDDASTNRKLIRRLLEREGAKVRVAENGQVAVAMAKQHRFDLILMDMQMPVMDGYSATYQLREQGFGGPIIALTAHAMKGDREKCEQAGCSGYLAKPINIDGLMRTMTECFPPSGTDEIRSASSASGDEPIHSLLPTEDEVIRLIVEEFMETLEANLGEMEIAWDSGDYENLARLAHWLKGAGETVGLGCFTEPASSLEQGIKQQDPATVEATLKDMRSLQQRLVV